MVDMHKRLGRAFITLARRIGHVQAWLLLSICYFLVVGPIALIIKALSDPLRLHRYTGSVWRKRPQTPDFWIWAKAQS